MVSVAWNRPGMSLGSCSASALAAAGDFRGKLRVKWFWLMMQCSRDHAAVEHLVQNGSGDLVDEEYSCLGVVAQKLDSFLLLVRWRILLLSLQLVTGCRLIFLDDLVSRSVQEHALSRCGAGDDQSRESRGYAN